MGAHGAHGHGSRRHEPAVRRAGPCGQPECAVRPLSASPPAPPARGVSVLLTHLPTPLLCSHAHAQSVVLRGVRPQRECEGPSWAARRCAPAQTRPGSPKDAVVIWVVVKRKGMFK